MRSRTMQVFAGIVLAASFSLWLVKRGVAQAPPVRFLFVRGTVAAQVTTDRQKTKDIDMPHANVFLVRRADPTKPIASALSDLSGRFGIKTDQVGDFEICVEADGFPRTCNPKVVELKGDSVRYGTFDLPRLEVPGAATVFGKLTLADGTPPRGFEPSMGVNSYGRVELLAGGRTLHKAYVNNFGEYLIPSAPVRTEFTLVATMDAENAKRRIDPQTGLLANRFYPVDIQLRNTGPKIRLISAIMAGKPVQGVPPGSTVTLNAVAHDFDGDALTYRWLLPDGSVVGPTTNPKLTFTVPMQSGYHSVTALVGDNRGGYDRNTLTLFATTGNVTFSGSVTDEAGAPVNGALADVNGRITNTNSKGTFSLQVPPADRFVFTLRQSGPKPLGTASYIYRNPIVAGRWTMRPAQVAAFDPKQKFTIQHKRNEKDCVGPQTSRMDWQSYLKPGLIEWQDGRGNVRSISEATHDTKAAQNVARLLGRINPGVALQFSRLAKLKLDTTPGRLPCQSGIQVDIPANSLEDPATHLEPVGNVQIAVSAIDLNVPSHMPGDYSAFDKDGNATSMESYGAGSVEITSGNKRLNLKAGSHATVTIPVDATQIAGHATLQPTIPFLFYDEAAGTWRQDGVATLNASKTAYVKSDVKHFSTMNTDILKTGQSCLAVEVDPAAGFTIPGLQIEADLPPSKANPGVIQTRNYTLDSLQGNVMYNLPVNTDIVITPIISGVRPDGSSGTVPAGIFVVNTGGPQSSVTNPPTPNPDGTYYAESGGVATGPCGSRVTLKKLTVPPLASPNEFLQGLFFESSNINEFSAAIGNNIRQGAVDYYAQADPRSLRASFNKFKTKNKFGQALGAGEAEFDAQYANSGDLGFGRDMHCRRNTGSDAASDYACYVTNYGQPPKHFPDQQDADDALGGPGHNFPDATVAMEYSRIENPLGVGIEFPDNGRAVKFFVYNTSTPDVEPPITDADLDGFGHRPVPQLCMICHGGNAASVPADIGNPSGPKKGAFANRSDILSMSSNFLPFDLHFYNFPLAKSGASQQGAFKNLNVEIVRQVDNANGARGAAVVELIDALYNGSATQLDDAVIMNWDAAILASNSRRFYKDVFARACRTCHTAQPFSAPPYTNKTDFQNDITSIQSKVCSDKVMPHAKRTNDWFWTSIAPNMPGFLQQYGQTLAGWDTLTSSSQCGLFVQPGTSVSSIFPTKIYPILTARCSGCHSAVGNANYKIGNAIDTYNSLLTAIAKNGTSKYIVPNNLGASLLYQRITTGAGNRMPLGGPDLTTAASGTPPQATVIQNWINTGATF